ncbi:uncharacterized protein LOC142620124 [Castanea sativa]|uniref:uncharacterized protein LOC142620124 n=1 Tax=Castanea sativa TaxID=21020 RepID=UPI003F64A8AF
MDRIDNYKRVEEDQKLGKGKEKVVSQDRRDFRSDRFNNNRPRRDFSRQSGVATAPQLVRGGKLKQFIYHPVGQGGHAGSGSQRDTSSKPPLGTINVVLATPRKVSSHHSRVISVAQPLVGEYYPEPKRSKTEGRPALSFSDDDEAGTLQPHDDALVVMLKIGGYNVKQVMVDQGSGVEIMYPNLYKGLGLKLGDLTSYDSPVIGFDGKVIIPMGQIKLPMRIGAEIIDVNFIVMDAFSPYIAIVVRA